MGKIETKIDECDCSPWQVGGRGVVTIIEIDRWISSEAVNKRRWIAENERTIILKIVNSEIVNW